MLRWLTKSLFIEPRKKRAPERGPHLDYDEYNMLFENKTIFTQCLEDNSNKNDLLDTIYEYKYRKASKNKVFGKLYFSCCSYR